MSSPWEQVIAHPQPSGHLLQLYDEYSEISLIRNVSRYLSEGLLKGEGLLLIANAAHAEAFLKQILGAETARREGQLLVYDSRETLARFMVSGQPDWAKFESVVGAAMHQVQSEKGAGLRAYGDMVNVLWNARQYSAAIRLEQYWNKLIARSSFSLFCAYSIDLFAPHLYPTALDGVLSTHTHLVPDAGDLEAALERAMQEVLGLSASEVLPRIYAHQPHWAVMPSSHAIAFGLRRHWPKVSQQILTLSRDYYRDSQRRPQ